MKVFIRLTTTSGEALNIDSSSIIGFKTDNAGRGRIIYTAHPTPFVVNDTLEDIEKQLEFAGQGQKLKG